MALGFASIGWRLGAFLHVEGLMRVAKNTAEPDDFITAQELGRQLGVSEASLARWRLWGQGPPFLRLTGQRVVRYSKRAVAEWLAARQQGRGR